MRSSLSAVTLVAMSAGLAVPMIVSAQVSPGAGLTPHERVMELARRQLAPTGGADAIGPDVIVGELHNTDNNGSMTLSLTRLANVGGFSAYGVGTSSCNRGDANVSWIANNNLHPVIPQNMYRLKTVNGSTRFEQVGASWCKHAFTALTQNVCNLGCNGSGGSVLGVGCSDPYTASRNAGSGSPNGLGPRYEVNPYTGEYPYPFSTGSNSDGATKRLRIANTDLEDTTANPGTRYFAEALYITRDDSRYGNGYNNASYRRATYNGSTGAFTLTETTKRTVPAIWAWKEYGNNGTPDANVMVTGINSIGTFNPPNIAPTGDGWMYVGSRATDLGNGTWHYEYAVYNLTSDRMGGSFSVPFSPGTVITNAEWHGVVSHGGIAADDATRNAAWVVNIGSDSITWSAPVAYNPATPTLGNGIRWGTLYNFRFDANVAPISNGQTIVGYYKPGTPSSLNATAWTPGVVAQPSCYANCDGSTTVPFLNVNDFICFQQQFAAGDTYANCDASTTAPVLNVNDFICFQQQFAAGCSAP